MIIESSDNMDLILLYCNVVIKPLENHLSMLEECYRKTRSRKIKKLIKETVLKKQECYLYLENLMEDYYN